MSFFMELAVGIFLGNIFTLIAGLIITTLVGAFNG